MYSTTSNIPSPSYSFTLMATVHSKRKEGTVSCFKYSKKVSDTWNFNLSIPKNRILKNNPLLLPPVNNLIQSVTLTSRKLECAPHEGSGLSFTAVPHIWKSTTAGIQCARTERRTGEFHKKGDCKCLSGEALAKSAILQTFHKP